MDGLGQVLRWATASYCCHSQNSSKPATNPTLAYRSIAEPFKIPTEALRTLKMLLSGFSLPP